MITNDKKYPFWKRRVLIVEAIFSDLIYALPLSNYKKRIFNYQEWGSFEKNIFEYYLKHKIELIKKVSAFLRSDWSIARLQTTTLAIILESIAEFHQDQTPKKVLIEQAVITAQKYSENSDYKLVNAILDNYFKSI